MKFERLISLKLKELLEQSPADLAFSIPPQAPAAQAPVAPPPPQAPQAPEPTPQPEGPKPLTAEGEVFLVRLLKKALFMEVDDDDEKILKDLPEINEDNASEVLTKIVRIMKNYSSELDVKA